MIDLDERYLAMVKDILSTYVPDHRVWAYGSRVKGNAHAGSDFDLVVLDADKNVTPAMMTSLRAAFGESNLPISVDIMNWSDIPEQFKAEINQAHEVVLAGRSNA